MLGRTILEVSLQAMYFAKDPDKFASEFFAHDVGQRNILFKEMAEHGDTEEIRTDVKKFFAEQNLDPAEFRKQRNWWGNRTIWDFVEEIDSQEIFTGAKSIYRSQYGPLSTLVHGAPFAQRYYIFQSDDAGFVDWRASPPHFRRYELAATLFTSAPTGFLDVIYVLAGTWGFDYTEDFSAARQAIADFQEEDTLKAYADTLKSYAIAAPIGNEASWLSRFRSWASQLMQHRGK